MAYTSWRTYSEILVNLSSLQLRCDEESQKHSFNKYLLRNYHVPSAGPATGDPGVYKAQTLSLRSSAVNCMRKAPAQWANIPSTVSFPPGPLSRTYSQSSRGWVTLGKKKTWVCYMPLIHSNSWRPYEWEMATTSCPPQPCSAPVGWCLWLLLWSHSISYLVSLFFCRLLLSPSIIVWQNLRRTGSFLAVCAVFWWKADEASGPATVCLASLGRLSDSPSDNWRGNAEMLKQSSEGTKTRAVIPPALPNTCWA